MTICFLLATVEPSYVKCSILTKFWVSWQIFLKVHNTNFHGSPSIAYVYSDRRTHGRHMTMHITSFRDHSKAHKSVTKLYCFGVSVFQGNVNEFRSLLLRDASKCSEKNIVYPKVLSEINFNFKFPKLRTRSHSATSYEALRFTYSWHAWNYFAVNCLKER
jgi:hypothetical protein